MENQQTTQPIDTNPTTRSEQVIPEATKKNSLLPIVLTVIISAAIFGYGGYYFAKNSSKAVPKEMVGYPSPTPTAEVTVTPTADPESEVVDQYSDWETYNGADYSFKYPSGWATFALSETGLMVAPAKRIDDVKAMYSKGGGFGGGPFMTITISKNSQHDENSYKSDEYVKITSSMTTVDGISSTKYITEILQSSPMGQPGDKLTSVVVPYSQSYMLFSLLDTGYKAEFDQILSTVKFAK